MADEVECILHPAESHLGAVNGSVPILISKTATTAIYRDAGGGKILLRGRGFQYEGDVAVGGTVTGATFSDRAGAVYLAWEA
ncbi:hypothetical protein J2Y48_004870 [Mycoplana sp. BE70]|uniref:hypothetical protein n=1 Tax=Mycoplana sp. BE70 TaxID=2817775 RepID=UPI0028581679|nr:hypothetical protein [Mycoplana sp. BE70]MDR6759554.1 hypothetical protein [Mycoplana sp. BE70]